MRKTADVGYMPEGRGGRTVKMENQRSKSARRIKKRITKAANSSSRARTRKVLKEGGEGS